jgi:hypothetical protein
MLLQCSASPMTGKALEPCARCLLQAAQARWERGRVPTKEPPDQGEEVEVCHTPVLVRISLGSEVSEVRWHFVRSRSPSRRTLCCSLDFRRSQGICVCRYPSRTPGVRAQGGTCPWCEMIFSRAPVGVQGRVLARPYHLYLSNVLKTSLYVQGE